MGTAIVAVINIMPVTVPRPKTIEVSQGPGRSLNNRQDKKRDGGRTSEAMHDADDDWSDRAIPFHATEDAIQARRRHRILTVTVVP